MSKTIKKHAMNIYRGVLGVHEYISTVDNGVDPDGRLGELQNRIASLKESITRIWVMGDEIAHLEEVSKMDVSDQEKLAVFMKFLKELEEDEAHAHH